MHSPGVGNIGFLHPVHPMGHILPHPIALEALHILFISSWGLLILLAQQEETGSMPIACLFLVLIFMITFLRKCTP